MKTIVIYYSRTGNTKFVAEEIAVNLQADSRELADPKDRQGIWGYLQAGRDALAKKQTELVADEFDLNQYELIFLGCPVWAYNVPPALRTFLASHDLKNKKVILFCTQGSAGAEGVFQSIRELIPDAQIIDTKFFNKVLKNQDKVKEEISQWLQSYKQ